MRQLLPAAVPSAWWQVSEQDLAWEESDRELHPRGNVKAWGGREEERVCKPSKAWPSHWRVPSWRDLIGLTRLWDGRWTADATGLGISTDVGMGNVASRGRLLWRPLALLCCWVWGGAYSGKGLWACGSYSRRGLSDKRSKISRVAEYPGL